MKNIEKKSNRDTISPFCAYLFGILCGLFLGIVFFGG